MIEVYINRGMLSADGFADRHPGLSSLSINGYPVITIFWNIFLIFIPFFLYWLLLKYWRKTKFKRLKDKALASLLGFLWLMFIPNAAYVITDLRHISSYCPLASRYLVCPENAWMIIFFFIYASLGFIGFVVLLKKARSLISEIINLNAAVLFIWTVIPLISLGVLLGLVNRFNSWEIFSQPWLILNSALSYFTNSVLFLDWLAFTVGFYILYYGGSYLFKDRLECFKRK